MFLTQGNQLEWLIDGATLFPKLTQAVKGAQRSVNFMNMMFRVNSVMTNFNFKPGQSFDTVQDGDDVEQERLQDIMFDRAGAALTVNMLVWDAMNVPGLNLLVDRVDTADAARASESPLSPASQAQTPPGNPSVGVQVLRTLP